MQWAIILRKNFFFTSDVLEKRLSWPLGFARPFKPLSRFEVIQWTYFDKSVMYDFSDEEPTSLFPNSYYGDFTEILQTVKNALQERNIHSSNMELMHGFHRVDPKRGIKCIHLVYLFENK